MAIAVSRLRDHPLGRYQHPWVRKEIVMNGYNSLTLCVHPQGMHVLDSVAEAVPTVWPSQGVTEYFSMLSIHIRVRLSYDLRPPLTALR